MARSWQESWQIPPRQLMHNRKVVTTPLFDSGLKKAVKNSADTEAILAGSLQFFAWMAETGQKTVDEDTGAEI